MSTPQPLVANARQIAPQPADPANDLLEPSAFVAAPPLFADPPIASGRPADPRGGTASVSLATLVANPSIRAKSPLGFSDEVCGERSIWNGGMKARDRRCGKALAAPSADPAASSLDLAVCTMLALCRARPNG
jgi:hypothetical protein